MRRAFVIVFVLIASSVCCQPVRYTAANAHSHNDYEQATPFWLAYNAGFGSIEADIFLENNNLYVAHDTVELKAHRTLEEYYLRPLAEVIGKNNGHPFANGTKTLQLLIDIKTDSINTLNKLIMVLEKYSTLLNNRQVAFVITGNRPDESLFTSYPRYISFDGELFRNYSQKALTRISLLSDNFKSYSTWTGTEKVPEKELAVLQMAVKKAHQLHKPVRFWNCPDFQNAWQTFMHLGVDYLNTDHIAALSSFLKNSK